MLHASERPRAVASRIRGQPATREKLQRRLTAMQRDLIVLHRYAGIRADGQAEKQQRAATAIAEVQLAIQAYTRAIDALDPDEPRYETRPVRKRMAKMALDLQAPTP
jgi:hypothetical protein